MSGISTRSRWFLGMAMGSALALSTNCVYAQIRPDGTLPNNSTVRLNGSTHIIEGGTRAGGNLFHSFSEFSVPIKETAHFNNAADVQNIFSRVTGGSVSNIDGIIKANRTANLFLINPNGIVFGENASLNVGGSFVGTTANAIQFGDRGFFSATNPEAPSPLLTINPSALLFNQIAAASIQNNSVALLAEKDPAGFDVSGLRVPDGKSLLLVGGNINMDGGQLNAYGGRVELGGLAARGSVGLNVDGDKLSLDFPVASTRADISLTNGASVYVEAGGGGDIAVNARNLEITSRSLLSAGIGQGLGNAGAKAGNITLNATGDVKIDGNGNDIANNVQRQGIGDGGNITLSTNSLSLTNGAQLQAFTLGQGDAGNVIVNATKSVSLDDSVILSSVGSVSDSPEQRNAIKGNGGNIQITTPQLSLTNVAQLQAVTFGQGDAGNVIVNATKSVSLDGSGSAIFSSVGDVSDSPEKRNAIKGNGGNIQITTPQLSLTNGAQLQAGILAQGNSGSVIINATKSVSLDGSSYIFSSVGNVSESLEQRNATKGNGGNIQITTPQLSLTNGAELVASTYGQGNAGNVTVNALDAVSLAGNAYIFSTVESGGVGKGGDININTATLSLKDGAQLQTLTRGASDTLPAGRGDAGNVNVTVTGAVDIAGEKNGFPSAIGSSVLTETQGNGGNITIDSSSFSLREGAKLETSTLGQGNAGTIKVNAAQQVTISGKSSNFNSGLYVGSDSLTGTPGDIIVTSPRVTLDNTGILSTESALGNGGNINLQSDLLIMRRGALISTTAGTASAEGNGGNITINTPKGFIVAVPKENSNITANAFKGSGGKVQINATGIYGLTVLSRKDLMRLLGTSDLTQEIDFQKLPSSITAISQTNPNLNGQVNLNTPDADPSRGLTQLPINLVDASSQIDNSCNPGSKQRASSFTITGRGGLPPNPGEPLSTDAVDVGLVTLNHGSDNHKSATLRKKPTPIRAPIVQATGWTRNSKGEVVLTADASNVTPQSPWQNPPSCHGVQNN